MLFGGANVHLETLGIPGVTGYRQHLHETRNGAIVRPGVNGPVPAAWPPAPVNVTGFYTLYPNPDQLLAGELDTRLRRFISTAPDRGGVLTAYAEADRDAVHGGQFAPLGLTKDKLHRVHQHMQGLCRGSRVKYGAVTCGGGMSQVSFAVPGLDFYGINWYQDADVTIPVIRVLDDWRRSVSQLQKRPVLAIAGTNAGDPSARPAWFAMVYGWLAGYSLENGGDRALGLWSYWGSSKNRLTGPWLPGDTATITALTRIAAHCGNDA